MTIPISILTGHGVEAILEVDDDWKPEHLIDWVRAGYDLGATP